MSVSSAHFRATFTYISWLLILLRDSGLYFQRKVIHSSVNHRNRQSDRAEVDGLRGDVQQERQRVRDVQRSGTTIFLFSFFDLREMINL